MAIIEAPRLTPRVVALLMVGVFVVCLCADRLQCMNNGRTSMCIGKAPYRCHNSYCRTEVDTPTEVSNRKSCLNKGDAVVLIALVEVGPSITSSRSAPITSHMADELRERIDSGAFHRDMRNAYARRKGLPLSAEAAPPSLLVKIFVSDYTASTLLDVPRAQTRYVVSHDAVPLLSISESTAAFSYAGWEEAVNTALPLSRRNNASQLPHYFPGLYAALQNVSQERAASTASAAVKACNSVVLLVGILVHPAASVQAVWQTPWNAKTELDAGAEHVAGAVTRYLTTSKRVLKHVQRVLYYKYTTRLPQWRFECGSSSKPEAGARDVAAATEVCTTHSTTPSSTTCPKMCAVYDHHNDTMTLFNKAAPDAGNGWDRISSPSKWPSCYRTALSSFAPRGQTCAFEAETVTRVFDDCLHLSPEGARGMARCLLDQR